MRAAQTAGHRRGPLKWSDPQDESCFTYSPKSKIGAAIGADEKRHKHASPTPPTLVLLWPSLHNALAKVMLKGQATQAGRLQSEQCKEVERSTGRFPFGSNTPQRREESYLSQVDYLSKCTFGKSCGLKS